MVGPFLDTFGSVPRSKRWYNRVFVVIAGATLISHITTFVLMKVSLDLWKRWVWLTGTSTAVFGCAMCVWILWLSPLIESRDRRVRWDATPRKMLGAWRSMVWLPALGTLGFATLGPLIGWGLAMLERQPIDDYISLQLIAVTLAVAAPCTVIALVLDRCIGQQLNDNVSCRKVCFDCGYDLRGNPDATACPECGWAIAWKKAP